MAIEPGTRLGSYEILGSLGAGGMGEVYRAKDTKLGREVAIKVLPSALAQDPERLARFEREAKLLATLNHAHIGAIYGLDDYYMTGDITVAALNAVPVETGASFAAGNPRMLFEGDYFAGPQGGLNYDVSPDGQRFLMIQNSADASARPKIVVVENWAEELERLATRQ
jgi:hypothetical protein